MGKIDRIILKFDMWMNPKKYKKLEQEKLIRVNYITTKIMSVMKNAENTIPHWDCIDRMINFAKVEFEHLSRNMDDDFPSKVQDIVGEMERTYYTTHPCHRVVI